MKPLTPISTAIRSKLAFMVKLAGKTPVNSIAACKLGELKVKTGVKCDPIELGRQTVAINA